MKKHRADMLAAVLDEFDLHTCSYVGNDEEFAKALSEKIEREIEGGDEVFYLDEYGEDPKAAISEAFSRATKFVMGSKYDHDNIPVMNAVAELFNLMCVQVGPCGVWCVQKEAP